jgi:hypothetical protein
VCVCWWYCDNRRVASKEFSAQFYEQLNLVTVPRPSVGSLNRRMPSRASYAHSWVWCYSTSIGHGCWKKWKHQVVNTCSAVKSDRHGQSCQMDRSKFDGCPGLNVVLCVARFGKRVGGGSIAIAHTHTLSNLKFQYPTPLLRSGSNHITSMSTRVLYHHDTVAIFKAQEIY